MAAFALTACSSSVPDAPVTQDESALRTLSQDEIVGSLEAGKTREPVTYTRTPTYRAFRIDLADGADVDLWIRSSNGDAIGWLLGPDFATRDRNDDAEEGGTTDAHIRHKVREGGAYYVAFREAKYGDASFTVTFAAVSPAASTASPASCGGPLLTPAEAFKKFAPGARDVTLGKYQMYRRHRACTPNTGCSTWSEYEPAPHLGDFMLNIDTSEKVRPIFIDQTGSCAGNGKTFCEPVGSEKALCDYYRGGVWNQSNNCYNGAPCSGGCDSGVVLWHQFEVDVREHCTRGIVTGKSGDQESELVLLATY